MTYLTLNNSTMDLATLPNRIVTRDGSYAAEETKPGTWTVTYVRVEAQPLAEIQVEKDRDGIWFHTDRVVIGLDPLRGIVALMSRIAKRK